MTSQLRMFNYTIDNNMTDNNISAALTYQIHFISFYYVSIYFIFIVAGS